MRPETRSPLVLMCVLTAALIGFHRVATAATPAQKCEAAKLKAAGKEIAGKMGCYAKAKHAGTAVDGSCLSTQQGKADAAINKADGACMGTAAAIDAAVDNCVTNFLNDDPGNSACSASSAKTIGQGANAELGCQAKEVTKAGTFAACDTKEDGKTTNGLTKAGGCANTASVLTHIDNCDAAIDGLVEPAPTTTTTTTTSTTTTTTTCPPPIGTVVKGALTATPGRFNYNLMLGLPGANSACNTHFPGSHACTLTQLQGAPASDLACLRDTAGNSVTSFWAIDAAADPLQQCKDDAAGGSGLNWEYGTAHTASRGEKVDLTNATGVLGPLQMSVQCNIAGTNWVGCCQ